VDRVLHQAVNADDYRLLHLVAQHDTDFFGTAATPSLGDCFGAAFRRGLAHFFNRSFLQIVVVLFTHDSSLARSLPLPVLNYFSMPSWRPRNIVFSRANSFLSARILRTVSVSPKAFLNFRRKSDSLISNTRLTNSSLDC